MYKLGILNELGYFKEEKGKWFYVNGDGKEWGVNDGDVEDILDQYKDADPDIDSSNPPNNYTASCGIDLNRTEEEDVLKINEWLKTL